MPDTTEGFPVAANGASTIVVGEPCTDDASLDSTAIVRFTELLAAAATETIRH